MSDTTECVPEPQRQPLPAGLARTPPGPQLAGLLAGLEPRWLGGGDLYELMGPLTRQIAHAQALLLAVLWEAARSSGDGESLQRVAELDEFSADQIAFELRWSRGFSQGQVVLAGQLIEDLPDVFAALAAGRVDLAKAGAFADLLSGLDDRDTARAIAARLLPKASRWTLAELRERLRYHIKRAEPDAAKRKYRRSVANRRVSVGLDEEGTAILSGSQLPPDRAAAAFDRIDRLARAARAAGDERTISQLTADAYLDLLAGRPFQLRPRHDPVTAAADRQAAADGEVCDDDLPNALLTAYRSLTMRPGWRGAGADSRSETGKPANLPASLVAGVPDGQRCCTCERIQPAPRPGNVDIVVELTTLMCLDDNPALVPGWGPVIADIARQVAADQSAHPAWRYRVTDHQGNLLHHGHTRRRPTTAERQFIQARDGTCKAPGCRRTAMQCDQDHQLEYAKQGPSHRANICCLCRHHHRLRHERGYVVTRVHFNTIVWDAPNRRQYTVLPDATLILTADDVDPPLPREFLREALRDIEPDPEDLYDPNQPLPI